MGIYRRMSDLAYVSECNERIFIVLGYNCSYCISLRMCVHMCVHMCARANAGRNVVSFLRGCACIRVHMLVRIIFPLRKKEAKKEYI